jgi:hypothetical protein
VITKNVILLTTLNFTKFLIKEASKLLDDEFDPTMVVVMDARNHNNFMWKNYILNEFANKLYDVYSSIKCVNVLWEALNRNIKQKMLV